MVLENYTRDFHNLIEWFKVKWAYESSPPPLRRTPLAWEVRKTSPCRAWNSSAAPKCTSPLQRLSPTGLTCPSPLDPAIIDSQPANSMREETIYKRIKDNRNNVAKREPKNIGKDSRKNLSGRENDRSKSKEKSIVQKSISKSVLPKNSSPPTKNSPHQPSITEVPNDRLPKERCGLVTVEKEAPACPSSSLNSTEKELNDSMITKLSTNSKIPASDFEAMKNKINDSVKEAGRETNNRIISEKKSDNSSISAGARIANRFAGSTMAPPGNQSEKVRPKSNPTRPAYSVVSRARHSTGSNLPETPKIVRSKTTLGVREAASTSKTRPGTSVMVRRRLQPFTSSGERETTSIKQVGDITSSVEVLTKRTRTNEDGDGWQTVRSRYRRGSTHNLNMSTRFHKPSTATSLPALSIESPSERSRNGCFTPDGYDRQGEQCSVQKAGKNRNNEVEKVHGGTAMRRSPKNDGKRRGRSSVPNSLSDTNSTSMIAAIFKSEAELLEKRIQQFMAAQAERERIILEEERKTEEADSQRSQQLSDEEAFLQRQILELESTEIDVDTETDETDGETVLEIDDREPVEPLTDTDDISLEDR